MNITTRNNVTSDRFDTWGSINWREVEKSVRNMQIKIAEATKTKDWKKVRNLQDRLTNSYFAKLLAVKVVTSNKGKNTPGVDKIIWDSDSKKFGGAKTLNRKGYKPSPLKRVEIPKRNGKTRALGIPTMRDRAMQCLYKFALEPVAEVLADKDSYGFRPRRGCHDAIEQCFIALGQRTCGEWVLEGDIEKCFDKISHEWLLQNIPMEKGILEMWLRSGFIWDGKLFPSDEGTPQGGIISPILANLALDGIESLLDAKFGKSGTNRRQKSKVHFVRYADDFVITGKDAETLEKEVKPLLKTFLENRGLKLSEEKTKITHIDLGFNFLGFNCRKYGRKLLIKPAKESLIRFLREVKEIFRNNLTMNQGDLIILLNVKIRGWCNYYRHSVAKDIFSYVGHRVWQLCWNWSVRRHPNKGKVWIKNRYFHEFNGRTWRFMDEERNLFLTLPDSIQIVRHTKIKKDAEVFSSEWDRYFLDREEQ